MTQDEIIEMAKQSGLHVATDVNWMPVIGLAYAKKLIELAAEKEREACAREVENVEDSPNPIINMTIRLAAAAVRERGQK